MQLNKKPAFVFILIGMLAIPLMCFAETPQAKPSIEDVQKETQDLLRTLKSYTADQRDEAMRKTKAALESLDKHINDLEQRIDDNWAEMDKTSRDKARASLRAVRNLRYKAAEWYGSMKSSTKDAWKHMKKGFLDSYEALSEAFGKAVKEF